MRIIVIFLLFVIAYAQDSLIYPEALSPQALEEFENEGKVSFRVSFNEKIDYRLKTQFTYKEFGLYLLNQGGEKKTEQTTSLSYSSKWINMGIGHGRPHIAKGLILGNTMMRFTPNLRNNAGIRPTKMTVKNYDYYKELVFFGSSIRQIGILLFRYDGTYCALAQYLQKEWQTGLVVYKNEKFFTEAWTNYKNNDLRASLNASLASGKLNHACGDVFYRHDQLSLFISSVYLHPEFNTVKTDSKWGSGLKPGSSAYLVGISLLHSSWRINSVAYCILKSDHEEQRFMLDLRYKKKTIKIDLSYSAKKILDLCDSDQFPFAMTWQNEESHICKMNVKIQIQKELQLICQLQGDLVHSRSYAGIIRLTYRKSGDLLRMQLSKCRSWNNALYFLRPLTASSYSIRRAPKEETIYMDLLYSKDIGTMKIYVLLRSEGINVGFDYKL
ncbi:MAG: hypothetical protein U9O95_05930 [Candidatus Marinimicrobia bacterium]|nr:hypothetical protein [Candidatus Neomarinimicrobiota bacterium]